jgi:hypothetical protein
MESFAFCLYTYATPYKVKLQVANIDLGVTLVTEHVGSRNFIMLNAL